MVENEPHTHELEQLFDESIRDETAFLRRHAHLPVEQQRYYLAESEEGLLHEFVGGIRIKKLTYTLQEDGLYFAGIRAMDSYRLAAEKAGYGSRTWYETEGMQNVQDALMNPDSNLYPNGVHAATVFSPPKDADYGYVFHFQKGRYNEDFQNETVETYIIEYSEQKGSITVTDTAARDLAGDEEIDESFHTSEDYLQTPFLFDASRYDYALPRILSALGVDEKGIVYSQRFQEEIKRSLGNWISEYTHGMYCLANDTTLSADDTRYLQEEIKRTKRLIWIKASDIKKRVHAEVYDGVPYEYRHTEFLADSGDTFADYEERAYYERQQPTIHIRPSDCRSVKSDDLLGVTTNKVSAAFSSGGTLGSVVSVDGIPESRPRFTCPVCDKSSPGPVGNTCPKCGITLEKYREMARKKGVPVCAK